MTFVTGSISHGQGHATIQTQMLVDRLGVDPDRIKFIAGDTDDGVWYGHRRLALDHHERRRHRGAQ
jgi:CO/xanthine dehydrogenase Mo-binding subunit